MTSLSHAARGAVPARRVAQAQGLDPRTHGPDRSPLPLQGLFGRAGASTPVPEAAQIRTSRLLLRPWRLEDFPAFARLMAEPGTFRFSERGPMSREEAWARFLRHAGHWSMIGHGLFAVVEQASGRVVGETGLADFRRGLGPAFDPFPEASWTTAPDVQGRGYATEAAGAAHDWLAHRLGARRTVCIIHADNAASLRLAARLGYVAFDACDYRGYPALFLVRRAGDGGDP